MINSPAPGRIGPSEEGKSRNDSRVALPPQCFIEFYANFCGKMTKSPPGWYSSSFSSGAYAASVHVDTRISSLKRNISKYLDSASILRVPEVKEAESNAEILVAVACSCSLACLLINNKMDTG